MTPTFCTTVDEYLAAVRGQVAEHGRNVLKPRDYIDPLQWQMCVGFESPTGWWVIHVRFIRAWGAKGVLRPVARNDNVIQLSNEDLVKAFGLKLHEALN